MEILDKENQLIAVEKVLEEMKKAEEFLMQWNSSWYEQLLDAHCLALHRGIGEADVREIEIKYEPRYRLANAFYSGDSIGIPLAKEILVGDNTLTGERDINFECEFGRIDWYGMNSHKSRRYFSFNNNGDIIFSKNVIRRLTIKHPKEISYETSYNVLSNDFSIEITLSELIQEWQNKFKYDYLTLSLEGNVLTEKFNDMEIIQDLSTGMKLVRIVKQYDKRNRNTNASVVFEAALNPDDSLKMEAVKQAELRIIEMVKCIRGELPLPGLIDRIDNCLGMIDKKQNIQIDDESNFKVLELESPNK